jgi:hypothetical protein
MEWINYHVAIITTVVIPFLRLITKPRIVQSMQTRPTSLIWFWWQIQIWFGLINKATVVLYWGLGYIIMRSILWFAWRICEEVLNEFHIEHDLHRLDSLLYILCIRRGCKLVRVQLELPLVISNTGFFSGYNIDLFCLFFFE